MVFFVALVIDFDKIDLAAGGIKSIDNPEAAVDAFSEEGFAGELLQLQYFYRAEVKAGNGVDGVVIDFL